MKKKHKNLYLSKETIALLTGGSPSGPVLEPSPGSTMASCWPTSIDTTGAGQVVDQ